MKLVLIMMIKVLKMYFFVKVVIACFLVLYNIIYYIAYFL